MIFQTAGFPCDLLLPIPTISPTTGCFLVDLWICHWYHPYLALFFMGYPWIPQQYSQEIIKNPMLDHHFPIFSAWPSNQGPHLDNACQVWNCHFPQAHPWLASRRYARAWLVAGRLRNDRLCLTIWPPKRSLRCERKERPEKEVTLRYTIF